MMTDSLTQTENTGNTNKLHIDVLSQWRNEFIERIKTGCKSTKQDFNYIDALKRIDNHTARDKCFIDTSKFLNTNPLRLNDYTKYVTTYIENGKKLNIKYFRNNVEMLEEYYAKVDTYKKDGIKYNPFSKLAYRNYVLFMILKLKGQYTKDDDSLFNVEYVDNREYNPLSKIPRVLRGELPIEVKEYDIKRAFPTFIDMELNTNHRATIYDKLDKKTFATLLNSNATNPKLKIDDIRKSLSGVYGKNANRVLTEKRFNNKGQAFLDFTKIEKQYIERFINENNLSNYVRLHDGIFVLKDTVCENVKFDIVEFAIKECITPPIENNTKSFYLINDAGKVETSRVMYADFFKQENFIRISTADDKIQLLRDTNNVIDYFNHKTNIVSFLESNINENSINYELVRETIAKECFNTIYQSFTLIPPKELVYYSDAKTNFGLPFKNGFYYFDTSTAGEIKNKEYKDVSGFFTPHKIQSREFQYTDEVGMFEQFLIRASLGKKEAETDSEKTILNNFKAMFGYLCHTYKDRTNAPCIILTDEDANDENRNGGRGKTILGLAVKEVQPQLLKGGKEFKSDYGFLFDDLDKKYNSYFIDDVPAGFKYDDLYTNILGDINCHRKGIKADTIEFENTPKFLITTNWVVRYDENNASTNRRFLEYKFTDYYNLSHTPKEEFKCTFFQEWSANEWNRFYSFVFRCVKQFLKDSLAQIEYDKTKDNYKAYFNSEVTLQEFERIILILMKKEKASFNVSDFLELYRYSPLYNEKLFSKNNVKKYIDVWFKENTNDGWNYNKTKKTWQYEFSRLP